MKTIRPNKYYSHKNFGGVYMVIQCGKNNHQLINIENGSRWGDTINPSEWNEQIVTISARPIQ